MVVGVQEGSPGLVLTHPNRDKAECKVMRAIVSGLLVASAVALFVVIIGGWDQLVGLIELQIAYGAIYLLMAFYVARWKRGVLPLAAALATLLAIFAAISAPQWLARDKPGFISPTLDNEFLGLVTLLILVLQLLVIVSALVAFRQEWSVELEVGANTVDGGSGDSSQSRPVIPTRVTVDGDIAT